MRRARTGLAYCQRNLREAIPKQTTSHPSRTAAHRRRLAGAVRAKQPEDLAPRDLKIEAVDSADVAVPLDQAAHTDDGVRGDHGRHLHTDDGDTPFSLLSRALSSLV